jgi:hypothetical protein
MLKFVIIGTMFFDVCWYFYKKIQKINETKNGNRIQTCKLKTKNMYFLASGMDVQLSWEKDSINLFFLPNRLKWNDENLFVFHSLGGNKDKKI